MKWWKDPLNWLMGLFIFFMLLVAALEIFGLYLAKARCERLEGLFLPKQQFCVKDGKII